MPSPFDPLLPTPQSVRPLEGVLDPAALRHIAIPDAFRCRGLDLCLDAVCKELRIFPERRAASDGLLTIGTIPAPEPAARPADGPEAYSLQIAPGGLSIDASAAPGVLHALRTLRQLAERAAGRIPCCTIADSPGIALRGYHLDCKSGLPDLPGLYAFAERLADWKINALLVEYEDRFPFSFAPEITLPGSPTLAEWDAFLNHCRDLGMRIIPLVQTHGHLNYVLRHPRFTPLGEGETITEICPSNPDAVRLVESLLEEVLALHGPDDWFHIGADEAWNLATCPRCRQRLEQGETKLDLFCEQVLRVRRFLEERGKRVLMWCDMFWRSNAPEEVLKLPKDILLCEWIYTLPTAQGSPRMAWNGRLLFTERYRADHPELPVPGEHVIERAEPKAQDFARRHLRPDPATGIGRLSAHAEYFLEQGFEVLGVGAARAGQSDWLFGQLNLVDRFNNIANWADYASKSPLRGVIISSWSRGSGSRAPYSPWRSALDTVAASAQYLWAPATTFDAFVATAAHHLFGADVAGPLGAAYRHLGIHREFALEQLRRMAPLVARGREHLALLRTGCEFDLFREEMSLQALGIEKMLSGVRRGRVPLRDRHVSVAVYLDRIGRLLRECTAWRDRLRQELAGDFRPEELDEYVDSRLDNLEFRLHSLRSALQGVHPAPPHADPKPNP